MRVAIFSDIHGNAAALEAVLADIRRNAAPDQLVVAGDLVEGGPRPAEVLALLRGSEGALFVMGNTDRDILRDNDPASQFTRAALSDEERAWLAALPFSQRLEPVPGHALLVVHANPRNLDDALKPELSPALVQPLLAGVDAEVIAFGHYHVPYIRELGRHTLVDVSSVGLPRDGLLRAVYVTLTFDGNHWQIAHHRVRVDYAAVARDYEAVGFPNGQKRARKMLEARY